MGGPWRARDYDPRVWRPPAPRASQRGEMADSEVSADPAWGVVIGYVASVVTLGTIGLILMMFWPPR